MRCDLVPFPNIRRLVRSAIDFLHEHHRLGVSGRCSGTGFRLSSLDADAAEAETEAVEQVAERGFAASHRRESRVSRLSRFCGGGRTNVQKSSDPNKGANQSIRRFIFS